MAKDDRQELVERWRVAHAEYRAEVALGFSEAEVAAVIEKGLRPWPEDGPVRKRR